MLKICKLNNTRCKCSINKYYDYGFVSGTADYCLKAKKFTSSMIKCPLFDDNQVK